MTSLLLDTEFSVSDYLKSHDFTDAAFELGNPKSIEVIKGGTTNFAYRLMFNPPQDDTEARKRHVPSAILKFAAEYATNDPTTPFSSERQLYEVRAMTELAEALASQPEATGSLVNIPTLYHFDEKAHVIIMEDVCPPNSVTGRSFDFLSLEEMCQHPVGDNAVDVADQVGQQLANFLIRIHRYTASAKDSASEALRGRFIDNEVSKEIDVDTCFRDVPKKLRGFDIVLDPHDAASIDSIIAELVPDYVNTPESIIMGDFWFGNMILKLSGPKEKKKLEAIGIIDWEFVTCAPSYVDLAHFLSEIWLSDRFFPSEPQGPVNRQVARSFFQTYRALGGHVDARKIACYVGGHIACFQDFMDWNDTDGFKKTVAKEGAVMMVQANAGQWDKVFANSDFLELLLKPDIAAT